MLQTKDLRYGEGPAVPTRLRGAAKKSEAWKQEAKDTDRGQLENILESQAKGFRFCPFSLLQEKMQNQQMFVEHVNEMVCKNFGNTVTRQGVDASGSLLFF